MTSASAQAIKIGSHPVSDLATAKVVSIAYWICTALAAFLIASGGLASMADIERLVEPDCGILGGAISFGAHVWDHAAGVALIRAAGGIVTNLDGSDWTTESRSALAGAPGVHAELLELLQSVGAPEDF